MSSRFFEGTLALPETKASDKRIRIIAWPATRRQLRQLADVASSYDHIVRLKRGHQTHYDVPDITSPFRHSGFFQSTPSNMILERSGFVRKVA